MRMEASIGGRLLLALPFLLLPARAGAQVGERLDLQSRVPQAYDRGRNVSVAQAPRPDYDALGIRLGGWQLFPRVEAGAGATTNTYLSDGGEQAAPFVYVEPSATLGTDWSRHLVQISASSTLRNYIGESRRNERVWDVGARGRLDMGRAFAVEATASASRNFENAFSGDVASSVAALSRYRRDFVSAQATYTSGRFRSFALVDYTDLRFGDVRLLDGGTIDQRDRNRSIARVTGQIEYARTPSVSLFGQLSADKIRYDIDLATGPNLDSRAARLLGGANLDIAGRARGTLGIGYSVRDYDAGIYKSVKGLSVDSRLELFPTRLFTVTLEGERTIEDAALRVRSAYWNTRFGVRGDYELRRNLIVTSTADYSRQKYLGSALRGEVYRASLGARYLGSRRASLEGFLSYRRRSANNQELLNQVDEARFQLGVAYRL